MTYPEEAAQSRFRYLSGDETAAISAVRTKARRLRIVLWKVSMTLRCGTGAFGACGRQETLTKAPTRP